MEKEELELKRELKELKKRELKRRKTEAIERKKDSFEEKVFQPTAIYLSNLPKENIDEKVLIEEFSKYGVIRKDQDGNARCKLYKDSDNHFKGDALIVYAKHESVPIAIEMMDGYKFCGSQIKVEIAKFKNNQKRSLDDEKDQDVERNTKPSQSLKRAIEDESANENGHSEDAEEFVSDNRSRTIKIANILDIYKEVDEEESHDIQQDLLDGCLAIGPVEDIQLDTTLGEAQVVFKKQVHAYECCKVMNGRYFDGRELLAFMLNDENISQTSEDEDDGLNDDLIDV